nr:unnamed protein product [Callosobruchus analis]
MAQELLIQDSCDFLSEVLEDLKKYTQERSNFLTTVFTAVEKSDRVTVEKALQDEYPKEGTVLKDITTDVINGTTVKTEPKWSDVSSGNSTPPCVVQNLKEEEKVMPPPTMVPLRKKKIKQEISVNEPIRKSARTKGKKKTTPTSSEKSNDHSSTKTTRSTRSKAVKKTNTVPADDYEKEKAPEEVAAEPKKPEEQTGSSEVTKKTQEPDFGTSYLVQPGSEVPLDGTMVVDNPKIVKNGPTAAAMPDKTPNRQKDKVNGDVFSPVKSKVNAYEELIKKQNTPSAKATTPISKLPVVKSSSTSKQTKHLPAASRANLSSANIASTNSAMKASLAEMKERQRLKQEKEQEALRKKEALLQAQMEERKKKREEKQLKAQQQREQLERERSRTRLEQVNKLEEKAKKIIAVKEEKQQQYKEQQDRRRHNAKERYMTVPTYMKTPLPLLPSDSPYDSDDERYQKPVQPIWAKDLVELFEMVDPKRMKRTSSAIWDKAPMYSILHVTQDVDTSDPIHK